MDTLQAFAMGMASRDNELMVFDWDKAAAMIKEFKPEYVIAGLQHDLEWTAGCIYSDGKIVDDDYTFLASTWATPLLIMDGVECPCYRMESETPGWNANTVWPESAREILAKGETL